MPHKVLPITLAESKQAAASLVNAFEHDPFQRWLINDDYDYQTVAMQLMETWVNYAVRYGMALRTENFEAVALRLKPGQTHFTFWRMFRSGMLTNPKILGKKGFKRLQHMDKALKQARQQNMGNSPYLFCWFLGTQRDKRQQGFASALVQATFAQARAWRVPCYLETVTGGPSETIHVKFGYQAKSIIPLEGADFSLTAMENIL